MLINLTVEQQQMLLNMLSTATIKVSDYPMIKKLADTLSKPIDEKKKDNNGGGDKTQPDKT